MAAVVAGWFDVQPLEQMMGTAVATSCTPFSPEQTSEIAGRFHRDGFALIPGVLTPEECATARQLIDRSFADPALPEVDMRRGDFILLRMFEHDNFFRDLLVREPIISLVESILGASCHITAMNVVRNRPGEAISTFHVDDEVEFPLPEEVARHDARLQMPVFRLTVQIPLTDIPTVAHGPSEFVAGSHYSGRNPDDPKSPTFEGKKAVPVLCKAGDIYLHNGQCWHRGAPNESDRTRYLLQMAFGRRWVAQRFWPFLNYRMPDRVLDGAGDRLLRVLGKAAKGPYG